MDQQPPEKRTGRSRFPDGFRILQGKQEYITYIEHSSVRVWPSDVAGHYDSHMHSAVEIILPAAGAAIYHLPGETYRVEAGQVLFVPSGCMHMLTEVEGTRRHLILFEPNPLYSLPDMPGISPMTQKPIYLTDGGEMHTQVRDLLMQMVDCYFKREPMWNSQCYAYLLQAYALLGKQYILSTRPQETPMTRSIDPEIMNSAITYIGQNYMNDLSLEDVARFTGFSKYYFSRTFKDFFGISFSAFLTTRRLNAAANLLANSNCSIQEIARASGFGSVATFNRVFREHKNCTPTQYRAIYGTGLPEDGGRPIF